MRVLTAILFVGLVYFGYGCSDKKQEQSPKVARGPVTSKLGNEGTGKLSAMLADYYSLKNALIATDAAKAGEASKKLEGSASSFATLLAADTVNGAALKTYLDTIVNQSKVISGITDPKCEQQRIAFSPISNNMFSLLKTVEIKNAGIYKQYCPMAFNDKGAYWLSDESEIRNPYFGKKMLECGEVQDSL